MDDARQIENLLYRVAAHVDRGEFDALARVMERATIKVPGAGGEASGRAEIYSMFASTTVLFEDTGTPCTQHVLSNILIEPAGDGYRTQSQFTVFMGRHDFALQPIVCGRYHDQFNRDDSGWYFSERTMHIDLIGDVSKHLTIGASQMRSAE